MLTSSTTQEMADALQGVEQVDLATLLQELTTERLNEASQGFDTKSALEIARIINHEDAKVAGAVKRALPEIAQVIDQVARCLRDGGRLIYVGAGASGRIAALDSSECPSTYSTAPGQVQYIMAGGPKALASAVEVNEDSEELGQRDIAAAAPRARTWWWASPHRDARLTWWLPWLMPAHGAPTPPPSFAIKERHWPPQLTSPFWPRSARR